MKIINQYLKESILFNEKDTQYRLEEWKQSSNGLLLVTGYVGSGKSTLAKKIAKEYKSNYIELDTYIDEKANNDPNRPFREKMFDDMTPSEINQEYIFYQKIINNSIKKILIKTRKKKLVIEGIQLFLYEHPNDFKKHSIIVKGTSALVSMYRAFKRTVKENKKQGLWIIFKNIKDNMFIKYVESVRKLVKSWI